MFSQRKKARTQPKRNRVPKKKEMKKEPSRQRSVALASTRVMRTTVPDVSGSPYSGDGRVRVRHREYIKDIPGSVVFSASSVPINPGLSNVFPWLSVMAANFESYLFRSLKFEYETQKSASTSGSVMLAIDFDAADGVPVNKQQLMAYHNAVRSAVWEECAYKSSVADLSKFGVQRYIRQGNLSGNLDVKTYDVGNLIVATQGETDISSIGELYVEYDIDLITPQIVSDPSLALSAYISTTGASRALPFTGAQTQNYGLPVSAVGSTLTFNRPGSYLVTIFSSGTVFTDTVPILSGTAASKNYSGLDYHNTAATFSMLQIQANVTDVGQTVILDFTPTCTTLTQSQININPFPY